MCILKTAIPQLTMAILLLSPHVGQGQPLGSPAQGSRPGQTFQSGAPANQQVPAANPGQPQTLPANDPGSQNAPQRPSNNSSNAQAPSNQGTLPAGTPVIMEFSDLQCPDSARYNNGLKTTIEQRYGKAVYQWHDFPLASHPQAAEAAAAALCAGPAADRMRQLIMANQGQMSETVYAQYARQLGVDSAEFTACMRGEATMREVMNDKTLGESMGVRGTPTLVLGTADGRGQVKPVKVVKAYDPPQQVMAEIDSFIASASGAPAQQNQAAQQNRQ